jgi:hypothetical protein
MSPTKERPIFFVAPDVPCFTSTRRPRPHVSALVDVDPLSEFVTSI